MECLLITIKDSMEVLLAPPGPVVRQLTMNKWTDAETYMTKLDKNILVVRETNNYTYFIVRRGEKVYKLVRDKKTAHVSCCD